MKWFFDLAGCPLLSIIVYYAVFITRPPTRITRYSEVFTSIDQTQPNATQPKYKLPTAPLHDLERALFIHHVPDQDKDFSEHTSYKLFFGSN